jgi:hypothetical protein
MSEIDNKGAMMIAGAFIVGALIIGGMTNSKTIDARIDQRIDKRGPAMAKEGDPALGIPGRTLDDAVKDFGEAVDDLRKTNERMAADIKSRADMKKYMEGVDKAPPGAAIPPPPVALQIEAKRPQCHPVFTRGDIVRHRGMPEQHYVVVSMDVKDCTAYIRHPNLTGQSTFTDLLELEPKT